MKYQVKYGLRSTDEAAVLQEAGGHSVSVNRTALCLSNVLRMFLRATALGGKCKWTLTTRLLLFSLLKYKVFLKHNTSFLSTAAVLLHHKSIKLSNILCFPKLLYVLFTKHYLNFLFFLIHRTPSKVLDKQQTPNKFFLRTDLVWENMIMLATNC